jgi:hypothetical protein
VEEQSVDLHAHEDDDELHEWDFCIDFATKAASFSFNIRISSSYSS